VTYSAIHSITLLPIPEIVHTKKKKKKIRIHPISKYFTPNKKANTKQPTAADTAPPDIYHNRSFGSSNILDSPE
jgi:hypothetical protein